MPEEIKMKNDACKRSKQCKNWLSENLIKMMTKLANKKPKGRLFSGRLLMALVG
jgi:hypothetical protein